MQAACTQQFLEEKEFKYIVLTVKEGFAHYGFSRQVGYAYTSLPKKVDVYTETIKKDVQQHIRSCRTGLEEVHVRLLLQRGTSGGGGMRHR